MKILLITDTWHPQINGVVTTLDSTAKELRRLGHDVQILSPARFSLPLPFYPEIKLDFFARSRIVRVLYAFAPDIIHIATEGPIGWTARRLCLQQNRPFTTAYHTRFPEYLTARLPRFLAHFVASATYATLRRFHAPATATLVATKSIQHELAAQNFPHLALWSRGVDTALFHPTDKSFAAYENLPRPILLYVGRIAAEKNIPAFLDAPTSGSKVIIGTGPDLDSLRQKYPPAHFLGALKGKTLAQAYAAADLFVFPSTTDTFGLVLLEACASGLRIAASLADNTADIFAAPECQNFVALDADLQKAVTRALTLPDKPELPRAFATRFSWEACARQFLELAKRNGNSV